MVAMRMAVDCWRNYSVTAKVKEKFESEAGVGCFETAAINTVGKHQHRSADLNPCHYPHLPGRFLRETDMKVRPVPYHPRIGERLKLHRSFLFIDNSSLPGFILFVFGGAAAAR